MSPLPGFARNMFMPLSADDIPNLANAYSTAIYGNGQAVAASFGGISIVYDSAQIDSVDSWGGLRRSGQRRHVRRPGD